jgi:pSer/pThr/pTyr-binding forkhead associated (FHA) protein
VISDGTRERELQLVGRLVVGRDPTCDVSHDDSLLSRRHAEFVTAGDDVTVRDLGSRNGVFVNGVRAAERSLSPGDVVQIGPLRAHYVTDRVSMRATLDQLNADRTAMVPPPVQPQAAVDEDDVTRLIRPPRQSRSDSSAQAYDSSEEPTRFVRAPMGTGESGTIAIPMRVAAAAAAPAAAPAAPAARTQAAPAVSGTFVFLYLLTFAGVVFAAAALPLLVWRRAVLGIAGVDAPSISLLWLALPVAVALAAAYAVGVAINRRFAQALAAHRNRA